MLRLWAVAYSMCGRFALYGSPARLTLIIPIKIWRRGSNKVISLPNGETGKTAETA